MPDEIVNEESFPNLPAEMSFVAAKALARELAQVGSQSVVLTVLTQRIATMERNSMIAAKLINAMLRQVHSSDVFKLAENQS